MRTFKKLTANRMSLKDAGFFDGRFAPKIFKDKKKETERTICRKSKSIKMENVMIELN